MNKVDDNCKLETLCLINCDGVVDTHPDVEIWASDITEELIKYWGDDLKRANASLWAYRDPSDNECLSLDFVLEDEDDHRYSTLIFTVGEPHNFSVDIHGGEYIETPDTVEAMHMINLVFKEIGFTKGNFESKRNCLFFTK